MHEAVLIQWKSPEYIGEQIGGESAEVLACQNGSSNIKPEKRIPDTAVHLERFCTLWTKDPPECYWI